MREDIETDAKADAKKWPETYEAEKRIVGARDLPRDYYELGKRYVSNKELYRHCTWYSWCIEHWGTKWPALDAKWGERSVVFDTAWVSPTPVLSAFAARMKTEILVLAAHEDWSCATATVYSPECDRVVLRSVDTEKECFAICSLLYDERETFHRWDSTAGATVWLDDEDQDDRAGTIPKIAIKQTIESALAEGGVAFELSAIRGKDELPELIERQNRRAQ